MRVTHFADELSENVVRKLSMIDTRQLVLQQKQKPKNQLQKMENLSVQVQISIRIATVYAKI